jgi:hypothetical protein
MKSLSLICFLILSFLSCGEVFAADLVAADVTYTILDKDKAESGDQLNVVQMVFGDGVDTYPSGGVPLTKGNMGCPTRIKSLSWVDDASANGFVYKYDYTNEKIRIYQGDNDNASDAALIELVAATATPASATLIAEVRCH